MVHSTLKFTSSYFVSYHILYSMPKQNQKIRESKNQRIRKQAQTSLFFHHFVLLLIGERRNKIHKHTQKFPIAVDRRHTWYSVLLIHEQFHQFKLLKNNKSKTKNNSCKKNINYSTYLTQFSKQTSLDVDCFHFKQNPTKPD